MMLELTEEERVYLLNLLKRKQFNYQAVIKHSNQYDPVAVQRCASALKLVIPLIEKLSLAQTSEKTGEEKNTTAPEAISNIKLRLDMVEATVKKLNEELRMAKQKISACDSTVRILAEDLHDFMRKVEEREEKAEVKK